MFRSCFVQKVTRCLLCSTQRYSSSIDKSLLSKLRKKTGISLINCKKALEQFNNDLEQAEKWLEEQAQKEGWAKATKLQNRAMSQGLIALVKNDSSATLVEVNCETDFVAKNSKFSDLVSRVAQICHNHFKSDGSNKITSTSKDLSRIHAGNGKNIADLIALEIGNIGENMLVRRASFLSVPSPSFLGTYVYAVGKNVDMSEECILGKYGSIVELEPASATSDTELSLTEVAYNVSQHIVGMNPQSIGNYEDFAEHMDKLKHSISDVEVDENQSATVDRAENVDVKTDRNESATDDVEEDAAAEDSSSESDTDTQTQQTFKKDEARLLFQDYLLDNDITVGEFLGENAVTVKDFCRYECGEELQDEDNI